MAGARHPVSLACSDVLAIGSSIDQRATRLAEVRGDPVRSGDLFGMRLHVEVAAREGRHLARYRTSLSAPLFQSAVEHRESLVSDIVESEKRARSHRALAGVHDDARLIGDTRFLEHVANLLGGRQFAAESSTRCHDVHVGKRARSWNVTFILGVVVLDLDPDDRWIVEM